MRDFRDAKVMAHTLRAAFAAKGVKLTHSESLELIAKAFGVANWNTLSAMIVLRTGLDPVPATGPLGSGPAPERVGFSPNLEQTLHRSVISARSHQREHATLELLLFALLDDPDASAVVRACGANEASLKAAIAAHIDADREPILADEGRPLSPTAGFQRVIQRAVIHVSASGRGTVTGANVLVAIFSEEESFAAQVLRRHGITRLDAVNFMVHGLVKRGGHDGA
jgi:hypothetical protein